MAGHSQFKNIMHRKGRQDRSRSRLFGKLAREITVAAKLGLPDPGDEPAPAGGDHRGARREHAEGQYRTRDQEGAGRRRRELRRDPLRGLRAGRRRGDRRGADRQPQPHRRRRALLLHQERRQPGRDRRGVVHVRPRRRGRVRRRRWRAPTPCSRRRSTPAPTTSPRARAATRSTRRRTRSREVAKALEAKFGEPRKAALTWKPQNTVAVDDEQGEKLLEADRDAQRARRRAERLCQFRGVRRADAEDERVALHVGLCDVRSRLNTRHAQPCAGHPRLYFLQRKAWMAGTSRHDVADFLICKTARARRWPKGARYSTNSRCASART